MWLTGFDAPSVSTLYLDKPMKGHTLIQTIARANRVFPGKETGIIVDFLDVFKHLKRALPDYASDEDGVMPVKDLEKLLEQWKQAVDLTLSFCNVHGIDLNLVVTETDVFKNLSLFEDFANIIVRNDEVKNEFKVLSNTVDNLYDSLRPDFSKWISIRNSEAILYLRGIVEGKIRPEKLEKAKEYINELLDQSVIVAEEARTYTISEQGKEIDISKIDIDELREQFRRIKNKNP